MKNLEHNFNIFVFDSICKFNIYEKKNLLFLNKLNVFVKLKSIDLFFLKNFLFISKLISYRCFYFLQEKR